VIDQNNTPTEALLGGKSFKSLADWFLWIPRIQPILSILDIPEASTWKGITMFGLE
jgi:hypothetical protein